MTILCCKIGSSCEAKTIFVWWQVELMYMYAWEKRQKIVGVYLLSWVYFNTKHYHLNWPTKCFLKHIYYKMVKGSINLIIRWRFLSICIIKAFWLQWHDYTRRIIKLKWDMCFNFVLFCSNFCTCSGVYVMWCTYSQVDGFYMCIVKCTV